MGYDDIYGDIFGAFQGKPKRPEKGVQLHGKEVGGVFYVRADDVAALLETNDVLPKASALLRKRTSTAKRA